MTPEQASALSDEQLNRAMIWLYPPEKPVFTTIVGSYASDGKIVNYLYDYNLTMPLVIENGLVLSIFTDGSGDWVCERFNGYSTGSTYLRASCECLVLIALADK